MDRRIPPSARIEVDIEALLLDGPDQPDRLAELGRLGARLILQRAVEDEVAAFLGRARYERTPDAAGSRNGSRPRRIQTAEGEIAIAMPQVRGSLERFVSSVIPDTRAIIRTRPLEGYWSYWPVTKKGLELTRGLTGKRRGVGLALEAILVTSSSALLNGATGGWRRGLVHADARQPPVFPR